VLDPSEKFRWIRKNWPNDLKKKAEEFVKQLVCSYTFFFPGFFRACHSPSWQFKSRFEALHPKKVVNDGIEETSMKSKKMVRLVEVLDDEDSDRGEDGVEDDESREEHYNVDLDWEHEYNSYINWKHLLNGLTIIEWWAVCTFSFSQGVPLIALAGQGVYSSNMGFPCL
jgi:hypothetical protein